MAREAHTSRTRASGHAGRSSSEHTARKHTSSEHASRKHAGRHAAEHAAEHAGDDDTWSQRVTTHSNALDLDAGVFTWSDPKRIARSLKHSAEASGRRKSSPFRSAMSMLTFYINRAGDTLPAKQVRVLERAKDELRHEFGRD